MPCFFKKIGWQSLLQGKFNRNLNDPLNLNQRSKVANVAAIFFGLFRKIITIKPFPLQKYESNTDYGLFFPNTKHLLSKKKSLVLLAFLVLSPP